MKRISLISLACAALIAVPLVAAATPNPTSVVVTERVFNDCPFTTLNVLNNYPSQVSIQDVGLACFAFANLHTWTLSTDGTTGAVFNNDSDFKLSADLTISGTGKGEAGLRISPWWSQNVDGRFNVRTTDGEIACFGGRLPFYSFTGAHGLHYAKGEPIHLEVTYKPNGLSELSPATIRYDLTYQGNSYTSGPLPFDMANPNEDPPYGLWGMLNDGRVGGYVQALMEPGDFNSDLTGNFTNIAFVICPVEPAPTAAVVTERVFNDCPFTTLTTTNNYPAMVQFDDNGLACFGFANLHVWTVSDNGTTPKILGNEHNFRMACDMVMTGRGEGGLRVSPWWSSNADGLFNIRTTDGEIACFGGRLPFYSFTGAYGLRYTPGDPIHLEVLYRANGLSELSPATMEYRLTYQGVSYSSGPLPFDMANPNEDPPYGLWGMLNNAQAGGHMKAFMTPGDFTARTIGTFTNIEFENGATMEVDIVPGALKVGANGKWLTAFLEPPAGFDASEIDLTSLRLNGVLAADLAAGTEIDDHDGDGIADLTVKFNRTGAAGAITNGGGLVTITGEVGGTCFAGSDLIKVVGVNHPVLGSSVTSGTTVAIDWTTPAGMDGATADIYYSADGGGSWALVAAGVGNSGSYGWTVPGGNTNRGRVAVELTSDNETATGFSGEFTVASPVGVGDESVAFALKGAFPNPSADGKMRIGFSLPDGKRATLSLFDVSGRKLASRDVGGMGAGRHNVTLAERLKAGVYMVRLDRDGMSLKTRAAVVR